MTRAEAATIFARLLSEQKGEAIDGSSSFHDVESGMWYENYIRYLKSYSIIIGYEDGSFRPNDAISRAEFVTMSVRFYSIYNNVTISEAMETVAFSDITSTYWAVDDISTAANNGWIVGYKDGTFKGDNSITRAEVVTITNRQLSRTADTDYIDKNLSSLTNFTDISTQGVHWAYYDILESYNSHNAVQNANKETWLKK